MPTARFVRLAAGLALLTGCVGDPVSPGQPAVQPQFALGSYASPVDLAALAGAQGYNGKAYKISETRLVVGTVAQFPFTWQLPNGPFQVLGSALGEATAVSSDGAFVAGWAGNANRGVIWDQARNTIVLGSLGGTTTVPRSINRNGLSVGYATLANGDQHAFRGDRFGTVVDLGTLRGDVMSSAMDIRDDGTVVGWSASASQVVRMVSWSPRGVISVLAPGREGWAINSRGQIAGQIYSPTPFGMTWTSGTYVLHQATGVSSSQAEDINTGGFAAGVAWDAGGKSRAYVADVNGALTFLPRGASVTHWGHGINDCGDVVGVGVFGSNDYRPVWWAGGTGCQ